MFTLTTSRLVLRKFDTSDTEFVLRLLNEPSFIQFIGDKGVRNLNDAGQYILNGPVESYQKHGFGLYLVTLNSDNTPIGMCGLLKRAALKDVDIGFAFLPEFWNKGFALEAAAVVMMYGKDVLKLPRIVAITNKDNHASAKLLNKIGLRFDRFITVDGDHDETRLFVPENEKT